MKNLSGIFLIVFLMLSCGRDSILNNADFVSVQPEYMKMISSTNYALLYKETKSFVDLANFSEGLIIANENIMIEYFTKNLSATKFKSIAEALSSYNKLRDLHKIVIKENNALFQSLSKHKKTDILILVKAQTHFELISSLVTKDQNAIEVNCKFECINDAVYCMRDADANYAQSISNSAVAFSLGSAPGGITIAFFANLTHIRQLNACSRNLFRCERQCV